MKVAIIGNGPAGSTAAARFAQKGHDVAMISDGKRPQMMVGESLVPAIVPLLRELGIEDEVADKCSYKPGVTFVSRKGQVFEFLFDTIKNFLPPYAYNVPRPEFDDILSRTAIKLGARSITTNVQLQHEGDRVLLPADVLQLLPEWNNEQPDLVIDATGRRRQLGKLLGIPASPGNRRDVSYFAHYRGFDSESPLGQVLITHLRAGWSWRIPLPGRMSYGIVVPKSEAEKLGDSPEERLLNALDTNPLLKEAGKNIERISDVFTYANYQMYSQRATGSNWACVGDAFGFIDPMLSSGMWLAMHSADLLASLVDQHPLPKALRKHDRSMRSLIAAWAELIEYFYDGRIFAMKETGKMMSHKHRNFFALKMQKHLDSQFASMAAGATTNSPYSRGLLHHFSKFARLGSDPTEFAIA